MSENPSSLIIQEAACRAIQDTFNAASPIRLARITAVSAQLQLWHKIRACRERFRHDNAVLAASNDALNEMAQVYRVMTVAGLFGGLWAWRIGKRLFFPALVATAIIGGPAVIEAAVASCK